MIQDYLREMAEQQGLEKTRRGFQLTPKAYRLFQGKLLERIFSELAPSRTGRHTGPIVGEGAVELQHTKPYEFGDCVTQMDIPQSLDQRHDPLGRRARAAEEPKTSRSIAPATRPAAPPRC